MKVSDLTESHTGRYISFMRPGGAQSSGPRVYGVLMSFRPAQLSNGMPGVELTVALGRDSSEFGPLRGHTEVMIGGRWKPSKRPVFDYEPRPLFASEVKRVKVRFLGGPFDGTEEDIAIANFGSNSTNLTRGDPAEPKISYRYMGHPELRRIKGGLWFGEWRLVSSVDTRGPEPIYQNYEWRAFPAPSEWKPLH